MTSMIKPGIKPGTHLVPTQRTHRRNAPARAAAPAPEPLGAAEPARLSAKEAFCLGFAFSAALLLVGGGAAASIDDNVPPQPLSSFSAR